MRKPPKIWRGHQFGDGIDGHCVSQSTMWGEKMDCTVVPDSSCFPVEEAMALCKAVLADEMGTYYDQLDAAIDKYLNAVAKMARESEAWEMKRCIDCGEELLKTEVYDVRAKCEMGHVWKCPDCDLTHVGYGDPNEYDGKPKNTKEVGK